MWFCYKDTKCGSTRRLGGKDINLVKFYQSDRDVSSLRKSSPNNLMGPNLLKGITR